MHIVCVFVNTSRYYLDTQHLVAILDPNLHKLCKMLATNGKSVIEHGLLIFSIFN